MKFQGKSLVIDFNSIHAQKALIFALSKLSFELRTEKTVKRTQLRNPTMKTKFEFLKTFLTWSQSNSIPFAWEKSFAWNQVSHFPYFLRHTLRTEGQKLDASAANTLVPVSLIIGTILFSIDFSAILSSFNSCTEENAYDPMNFITRNSTSFDKKRKMNNYLSIYIE